jgi:hypothetical protein
MSGRRSVAKLLAEAQNVAGDNAVSAHRDEDYAEAREWQALAIEIQRLVRDSVAIMASPVRAEGAET